MGVKTLLAAMTASPFARNRWYVANSNPGRKKTTRAE
jgi:hypothetical protein